MSPVVAGELQAAWGARRLILKQVAPGVFFALFGTVIVCVGIWKPISIQSADRIPAPIIAALQKIVVKEELDDFERAAVVTWLKQRKQREIIYNEKSSMKPMNHA
jgi:hypothetical protein